MADLSKSSTGETTRGKPTHVTSSSTSSASHNDASSSIPTRMSKSASMARGGAGFVSPHGKSSLEDEHEEEEDDSSQPSNIWCRGDASTTVTSREDKTTGNLVVSL